MIFQKHVGRNYTTGFPGQIVRDGPTRGATARITSATVGADGVTTNRVSRAFGYDGELPPQGNAVASTYSAYVPLAKVGGANFLGILGHPQHYALYGNSDSGSLGPSIDLPQGAEGEMLNFTSGIVVEVFNNTAASKPANFGDVLAYVTDAATAAQNPMGLPIGALISLAPGANVPAGFAAVPNSKVLNTVPLAASAVGAVVSGYVILELTN